MTAQTSETVSAIIPALISAKKSFKPAVKNAKNPAFKSKYADLEAIIDAIEAALLANDILPLQQTGYEDGTIVLSTRLVHKSGEWVGSVYPVRPVKQDPQGEGSALTYARRYALMTITGIAPEDDDGAHASRRDEPQRNGTTITVPENKILPPDPLTVARNDLWAAAQDEGWNLPQVESRFVEWSKGVTIPEATEQQLYEYLAHIKQKGDQS